MFGRFCTFISWNINQFLRVLILFFQVFPSIAIDTVCIQLYSFTQESLISVLFPFLKNSLNSLQEELKKIQKCASDRALNFFFFLILIKYFYHLKAKENDRYFHLNFGRNIASEGQGIRRNYKRKLSRNYQKQRQGYLIM